ncbi:hypothetical protein Q8A67_015657 [Cirrhinus molitorella]|uniref:Uncharacterized protein n=1 Tax=Cirrhinus molitorella TaxID=172907 RepID=A0AA88PMS4_9TELE|nr:hypothetical protein Q8A67_015657 [Cirrhinus molitorella]
MDAVFLISVKAQLGDGLGCQAYRCAVTACLFYCSSLTPSRDDQLHFSPIHSVAVLDSIAKRRGVAPKPGLKSAHNASGIQLSFLSEAFDWLNAFVYVRAIQKDSGLSGVASLAQRRRGGPDTCRAACSQPTDEHESLLHNLKSHPCVSALRIPPGVPHDLNGASLSAVMALFTLRWKGRGDAAPARSVQPLLHTLEKSLEKLESRRDVGRRL